MKIRAIFVLMLITILYSAGLFQHHVYADIRESTSDWQELKEREDEIISDFLETAAGIEEIDISTLPDKLEEYSFTRVYLADNYEPYLSSLPGAYSEILADSVYIWEAEYIQNGVVIRFDISKSPADGEWYAPGCSYGAYCSYADILKEISLLCETEEVFLIGGLPFLRNPIVFAAIPDDPVFIAPGDYAVSYFSQLDLAGRKKGNFTIYSYEDVTAAIRLALEEYEVQMSALEEGDVLTGGSGTAAHVSGLNRNFFLFPGMLLVLIFFFFSGQESCFSEKFKQQ